ncbi:tRNA (guanosine(37)-N1)-methyltransferase TrmD [bacterium]|nr:tRNA (guanosine(37)-N1)-methyltransferase TrmD [bacterium]NCQ55508.1 tRNA (guanosine(37)-N1)-methyltransferase TrmD [Candidatus Parcubacteria bacterium]NCS67519.1 tRNA (guanosine(37)-N1)-methyltransferase TrmD [Candidatus Peregrinibacteria bacterium]NCS96316.1 tRNA (guanosine(37)-N1)-methyltransferase TrmD [bacterium]
MRFDILTLFPEAFTSFKETSIIGRAINSGLLEINTFDIRDFATNKHRSVDDVPYGGGAGMVMSCQPLFDSITHVKGLANDRAPVIFFTPHGKNWEQTEAENYANNHSVKRVILLCGHYEGIDQRIRDHLVDQEISLGSYVLTGGELPAQIFMDSVGRLVPGVIGKEASHQEESFSESLGRNTVEYPHYTRPDDFNGWKVPEVLLSGHHANIEKWRKEQCQDSASN